MTVIRSLALGKNNLEHQIQTEACHLVDTFANTKGPHQKVFAYNDFMHNLVKNEVQTHERQKAGEPRDLIDFYLIQITKTKDDPTSTFNKDNMVQTVVDLLLGGTETTSTTLLWALLYMVQYPEIQGHRVCLGEQMARVELFIIFTNLLRSFTFQLPEGVKEINLDYILGAILQPHPYKLCAIPR
ncbi:cytochrome p450 2j2-like [Limosa lapponica baueri]|uniref:Cytochrome p450 2j2-like n=1 Tax=Limosa lapponica baueri TaxID=1758121 RepID=A0A2I0T584_LIMLA|nr:cytochrome p450 2j2-like [Limosa lapponica baueri]